MSQEDQQRQIREDETVSYTPEELKELQEKLRKLEEEKKAQKKE